MSDSFETSHAFTDRFEYKATQKGPLSGLTFAVKDLIDIAGYKTGCGNPAWKKTHPPAACNAVCVDQLLEAGADCLGKTITDELAFGLLGENAFFGTPLNPKAPERVPGGSSSGSASAVACGLVDFAIGTDTGGSVRVPASNCGLFGLRPSHGFISVAGVNPFAPTFDTVGIFARSIETLMKAASVLLSCEIPQKIEVGKIHLIQELFSLADQESLEAFPLSQLKELFPVKITSLTDIVKDSSPELWKDTFSKLQRAEIWSSLGTWIEEATPEFGPQTEVSFLLARSLDRRMILDLCRLREDYFRKLQTFLGSGGILCIPTTPSIAPLKGSIGTDRSKEPYFQKLVPLTSIAGIGRLPQITLPFYTKEGIPVGLSFLAGHGKDAFLLRCAHIISKKLH